MKRVTVFLAVTFILALLIASTAPLMAAGAWHIETVGYMGEADQYTSLALDSSGNPHISYYHYNPPPPGPLGDLMYASWDGTSWVTETVDSAGGVGVGGYSSLALDSSGRPRISYFDATNSALKYASWNGTSWDLSTVDDVGDVGYDTSLALDSSGNPHISYHRRDLPAVKYAYWDGTSWHTDSISGFLSYDPSLALDSSGNPHISYVTRTALYTGWMNLDYVSWNGTSWDWERVEQGGFVGEYSSLALDSSGRPRISYFDDGNGDLKYASWDGTSWDIAMVDGIGDVGKYSSLALDSSGNPRISYFDSTNGALKYAAWNGTLWQKETVVSRPSFSYLGMYTSLALDSSGNPRISFMDHPLINRYLMYADLNNPVPTTPTINWSNPADITYGTPLSGTQLNATATANGNTVDGTFLYTPVAGTVLGVGGGQTLHVEFTPTDTTMYTSAEEDVIINVLKKPITVTADAKTKVYGDVDPSLTYTCTPDLVGGDGFSGALERDMSEKVGSYPIKLGTLTAGPNYDLSYVGADLTIIKANVTVKVSSSTNPASILLVLLGRQKLTFTAAVTAVAPGAGMPSGTVTFYDGTRRLGTGILNSAGKATNSTSPLYLGLGRHSIKAVYVGDAGFNASTSPILIQVVRLL
jgi:MBG domain (YGX type)/Bacterial Ig-like domain (group 3)